MILTFIAPGAPFPIGGVTMIYEFASAMARRGHEVNLFHYPVLRHPVSSMDDLSWFPFDEGITHFLPPVGFDPNTAPPSDVIFGFSSEAEMPRHLGLPVAFIQGYRMVRPRFERRTFRAPCPKICVAKWLVDVGIGLGVPAEQLIHIPLGLRHDRYRLVHPVEGRPPRLSFCYNPHPQKDAPLALEVLARVKELHPDVEARVFGAAPPTHEVPGWVEFRVNPAQEELVSDIYNRSRIFLCTSEVEGFGLPNIEAMACGAALVTTDNGGSQDYAVAGRTAMVSPPGDADAMVANVGELLRDDARRVALAQAGREHVRQFDWDRTGALLEEFLVRYLADPVRYGRPAGA